MGCIKNWDYEFRGSEAYQTIRRIVIWLWNHPLVVGSFVQAERLQRFTRLPWKVVLPIWHKVDDHHSFLPDLVNPVIVHCLGNTMTPVWEISTTVTTPWFFLPQLFFCNMPILKTRFGDNSLYLNPRKTHDRDWTLIQTHARLEASTYFIMFTPTRYIYIDHYLLSKQLE